MKALGRLAGITNVPHAAGPIELTAASSKSFPTAASSRRRRLAAIAEEMRRGRAGVARAGLTVTDADYARGIRARSGLTQAEFAARIGVPLETVRNWEQRSPRARPARCSS